MTSITSDEKFQPYGFLLHGGRRPSHSQSHTQSGLGTPTQNTPPGSAFPSPPASPSDMIGMSLLVDTEHGKALAEHLDFVVPPLITPVPDQEMPTSARCLFLGHLRFETTTAEVRWLIKKLCGVNPMRADIRGNGCCVVHLASDADVLAVRGLNRRVLFDHQGFWFARTGTAVDTLMNYVDQEMPKKKKSLHLPRDALVVEDSRASKQYRRSAPKHQLDSRALSTGSYIHNQVQFARSPMSPCSLGASQTRGFHDSPPEYVNPPSAMGSSGTSPVSHPAPPPYMHVPAWDIATPSYSERSFR